ncbi:MAG: hypothetical protein A2Y10_18830 [Planctomycetes bacterium GWF2_41_51]|nr:MAG: hypothetical protein A2Y10_18830 [Planctomycetes bacterium GWF2_41_51]HBG27359.1 hypothetical protein [Phycisphaerales bacterium]
MSFNIWEGIYSSFAECPKCGDGFSSERWSNQQLERITKLKKEIKQSGEKIVGCQNGLLPVLAAVVGNGLKNKVRILDFGGGLGNSYLLMTCGCLRNIDFEFFVLESQEVCRKGKEFFKDAGNIHFDSDFPEAIKSFDIIHLGSSIQYVEDWKGLLADFAKYNPNYILLADVPAGNIPTYATVQNYYESKIPYWFFNINDIISVMDSAGFVLLFSSVFTDKRLGKEQSLPQDNFPAKYRVGNSRNLLFVRNNK